MAQCSAIKANGERCKGVAIGLSEWCYQHAPQHAEERSRNGSKGVGEEVEEGPALPESSKR